MAARNARAATRLPVSAASARSRRQIQADLLEVRRPFCATRARALGALATLAACRDASRTSVEPEASPLAAKAPAPAAGPSRTVVMSGLNAPRSLAIGPDGALYVSTLTGVPFTTGAASILRVADGGTPQPFATGFKTITDLAFGPDGSLYVLQYASGPGLFFAGAGKVVRVAPDGQRADVVTGLTNPTGIVVAGDGTIYVSNRGNVAGVGEVLRIVL